jgi:hypothetical protein
MLILQEWNTCIAYLWNDTEREKPIFSEQLSLSVLMPFHPQQRLAWARTRISEIKGWWLNIWALAQPFRWRWVVNWSCSHFTQGETTPGTFGRNLGGLQSRTGRYREEKKSLSRIKCRSLSTLRLFVKFPFLINKKYFKRKSISTITTKIWPNDATVYLINILSKMASICLELPKWLLSNKIFLQYSAILVHTTGLLQLILTPLGVK